MPGERPVGAAMGGTSWTDAAHHRKFTDSAHLSRTCRRMFGLAPTILIKPNFDDLIGRNPVSMRVAVYFLVIFVAM
jgi:AraC family transcriptional regulator